MNDMEPTSISSLVSRAQKRDKFALNQLINFYADRLLASVRMELGEHLRQRLESQDIVQHVYLDALKSIDRFVERDDEAFFRWLKQIAIHRICDAHRQNFQAEKRRGEVRSADIPLDASWLSLFDEVGCSVTSPSFALARSEQVNLLREAMLKLQPRYRDVIRFRYLEQLSVADTAERLGCSERAVRSLCVRALIRLRELLEDVV